MQLLAVETRTALIGCWIGVEKKIITFASQRINEFKMNEIQRKTPQ